MSTTLFTSVLKLGVLLPVPGLALMLKTDERSGKLNVTIKNEDYSPVHAHEEMDNPNESVNEDVELTCFEDGATGFIMVDEQSTTPPHFEVQIY